MDRKYTSFSFPPLRFGVIGDLASKYDGEQYLVATARCSDPDAGRRGEAHADHSLAVLDLKLTHLKGKRRHRSSSSAHLITLPSGFLRSMLCNTAYHLNASVACSVSV
jgi:hypothetical protein